MDVKKGDGSSAIVMPVLGMMLDAKVDVDGFVSVVKERGFNHLKNVLWENRIVLRGMYAARDYLNPEFEREVSQVIVEQEQRKEKMLEYMSLLMEKIEFEFVFIKTPDNYPDFGHDVDVLSKASGDVVRAELLNKGFRQLKQTVAERIADKINFVYGDFCNVEVHSGRIGELGEHRDLAFYMVDSKEDVNFHGIRAFVPNYTSRIFLITLQRLYRHFNLRACDVYNVISWFKDGLFSPSEVLKEAERFGIDPGVKWLFKFVNEVYLYYFDEPLFSDEGLSSEDILYCSNKLIRFDRKKFLPMMYGQRLLWDLRNLRLDMLSRELLVIPLSITAIVMLKFFGKEGIW